MAECCEHTNERVKKSHMLPPVHHHSSRHRAHGGQLPATSPAACAEAKAAHAHQHQHCSACRQDELQTTSSSVIRNATHLAVLGVVELLVVLLACILIPSVMAGVIVALWQDSQGVQDGVPV